MIDHGAWWLFAAILPLVYWNIPAAGRPVLLAVASFAVLFALSPLHLSLMLGIGLLVYASFALPAFDPAPSRGGLGGAALKAIGTNRVRAPVLVILCYLLWFKYVLPLEHMLAPRAGVARYVIPLGISYFSFKLLHYAIERGHKLLPAHSLKDFLSWLFLLPTFTSGPIERFEHFVEHREDRFRVDFVVEGGSRIALGLIKKFTILPFFERHSAILTGGDWIAFAQGSAGEPSTWAAWAYLGLELLISYLDFSAYTDIAIGASRLFGLRIMENFNYPLLATNLVEFWRRYHMSLTNWCRSYVYMPTLGYTRNPYAAVTATFVIVGVWHAGSLNWVIWGLWHGLGQAVVLRWMRFAQKRRITFFKSGHGRLLGWAITMIYVSLGCAFEATPADGGVMDSFRLILRAFGF
ncbi:MAG TPA: MBOAT family O-acyltransferase [Novosphingobium sp.]